MIYPRIHRRRRQVGGHLVNKAENCKLTMLINRDLSCKNGFQVI